MTQIRTDHYFIAFQDRVLVTRFIGQWSGELAEPFFADFKSVIAEAPSDEPWATLLDLTDWTVLSDDALRFGLEIVALCDAAGRQHSALMMGSLAVGQALVEKRIIDVGRTNLKHFPNEAQAREWLNEMGYLDA